LDELDGVGVFVEVEQQVPDGVPGEAVEAELSCFVESLGNRVERCLDTYDSLLRASRTST
jgi:adenylate cyclase class IV